MGNNACSGGSCNAGEVCVAWDLPTKAGAKCSTTDCSDFNDIALCCRVGDETPAPVEPETPAPVVAPTPETTDPVFLTCAMRDVEQVVCKDPMESRDLIERENPGFEDWILTVNWDNPSANGQWTKWKPIME